MKNRIGEILERQGISILRLSEMIGRHYPTTHRLVHRDTLNTTSLDMLNDVAKALRVEIKDLYEEDTK